MPDDPLIVVPLRLHASTVRRMKEAVASGRYHSEADIARKAIDSLLGIEGPIAPDPYRCRTCGTSNISDAIYCKECGRKLS